MGIVSTHSNPNSFIWQVPLLICVSLLLGICYIVFVHAGLPGDEAAHFENVQFYSEHLCMPVLGEPGVSYEGQMGPVYYVLAGLLYKCCLPLGPEVAFYAIRISGLLLIPPVVVLAFWIARLMLPVSPRAVIGTTAFVALNPSLISIAASIQNDILSIFFSMAASVTCFYVLAKPSHLTRKGLLIGTLVSVGILTKATVVFFIPIVPIYALSRLRGRHWRFNIVFILTVTVLAGWFFIRNYWLYGDFSAQVALTKFNYHNNPPPTNLLKPQNLIYWLWVIESYYWLPIQYYRDAFHAQIWLRCVIGFFTVSGVAGFIIWVRHICKQLEPRFAPTHQFAFFLLAQYAACFAVYTYSCMRITHFAPRVTFPTIVVYAFIIGCGNFMFAVASKRQNSALYNYGLIIGLLAANIYVLKMVLHLPAFPFYFFVH